MAIKKIVDGKNFYEFLKSIACMIRFQKIYTCSSDPGLVNAQNMHSILIITPKNVENI